MNKLDFEQIMYDLIYEFTEGYEFEDMEWYPDYYIHEAMYKYGLGDAWLGFIFNPISQFIYQ